MKSKGFKEISFELYDELQLSSHVRFDFRYSDKGIFLIDVNSNPNLAKDDDFAFRPTPRVTSTLSMNLWRVL